MLRRVSRAFFLAVLLWSAAYFILQAMATGRIAEHITSLVLAFVFFLVVEYPEK